MKIKTILYLVGFLISGASVGFGGGHHGGGNGSGGAAMASGGQSGGSRSAGYHAGVYPGVHYSGYVGRPYVYARRPVSSGAHQFTNANRFGNARFANANFSQRNQSVRGANNLRAGWQNHVFARHSSSWHRDWDRGRDHWWHGHRCHFIGGSWVIFDFGWDPWWWSPWPWWYPDYYYPYPYGGYGPDYGDSSDYEYDQPYSQSDRYRQNGK